MPEQTTVAVSKFFAPMMAFAGAVVMLLWRKEMEPRKMLLAVTSGPLFAELLTPVLMAWLRSAVAWLPNDGTGTGAVAFLIGMLGINLVAVVSHIGQRAETTVPDRVLKEDKNA